MLLKSHLVEEPTDSTVCGSQNMELIQCYFGNHWTIQKTWLSTKTKKHFCVWECLFPHGQFSVGQKVQIRQWAVLSPPVPNSIIPPLCPTGHLAQSGWHDSLFSQFWLNCKMLVIFTKLPLIDRSYFFFLLLASAFTFFLNKNSNLKIILNIHNTKKCIPIPHGLGKQQWTYQEPWGLLSWTGVQRVSQRKLVLPLIYSCLNVFTQLRQAERKGWGWGTVSEPPGSPLPHWLWTWPCDLLWPMGQQQAWCKQRFKKYCALGLAFSFALFWNPVATAV